MNAKMRKKAKAEALKRMKMLDLYEPCIEEFEREGKVNISEGGILFWANEGQRKEIEELEKDKDILVYFGIKSFTDFGEVVSYLIITSGELGDSEEAKAELNYSTQGITEGYVLAYVANHTYPDCSEMGSIVVKRQCGGLVRVG